MSKETNQLSGTESGRRFLSAPKRQGLKGSIGGVEPVGFDRCDQKHGIGGDVEGRLARDGFLGPHLSLSYAEEILFFFLVGFDFPTIKVGLQSSGDIDRRIADEQVGLSMIEKMSMGAITKRCDNDQAHWEREPADQGRGPGFCSAGCVSFPQRQRFCSVSTEPMCLFEIPRESEQEAAVCWLPPFALLGFLGRLGIESDVLSGSPNKNDAIGEILGKPCDCKNWNLRRPRNLVRQSRILIEPRAQILEQPGHLERSTPLFFVFVDTPSMLVCTPSMPFYIGLQRNRISRTSSVF